MRRLLRLLAQSERPLPDPDWPSGQGVVRGPGASRRSPEVFARLVRVKDRYDPDNVFRINNNIPPS